MMKHALLILLMSCQVWAAAGQESGKKTDWFPKGQLFPSLRFDFLEAQTTGAIYALHANGSWQDQWFANFSAGFRRNVIRFSHPHEMQSELGLELCVFTQFLFEKPFEYFLVNLFNVEFKVGADYQFRLNELKNFIDTAYIPDLLLAASAYKDEGLAGVGAGVKNYVCYGGFPLDDQWNKTLLPKGVILNGDIANPQPLDEEKIAEEATHSWYKGDKPLHPYVGTTDPEYTGYDANGNVKGDEKYSWCKGPTYDGQPFEVGPLARMVLGYAQGDERIKPLVDSTLQATGLPAAVLFSTLGRTAARGLETKLIADYTQNWINELIANIKAGDTRTWTRCDVPKSGKGRGMVEVPRGALGHWIVIEDHVIANYQAIVPSTWNCAPRNKDGKRGPYEESLIGTKLANADQPLEILRTIHSFDPCMACAVHIIRPDTDEIKQFRVL